MGNRITNLFGIKYPIIQAGMVWCSGWKLASAVSNAGGLGLIGAGSMRPEILKEHIQKIKKATNKPYGVNIPLMKEDVEKIIQIVLEEEVPIIFTSAGNPGKWSATFKKENRLVAHVVANTKFARKSEEAGVDAIVAEGFEAGGHNGREETTTLTLVQLIRNSTSLPLISAGGITNAKSMLAVMVLGAEGVQIGSRFAASLESSAHENYKKQVIESVEGDTVLTLKSLMPVRFIKNRFYEQIQEAEKNGASQEELLQLLGKGRARISIFEGNIEDGEPEIGQGSALISQIQPAAEIVDEIMAGVVTLNEKLFGDDKFQF
ncbi:MAG: DUF561 domain-containing protein [Bacteroidetes bacterium]|jgi:enoyl-[acyl-carrier protein] reductase II|nr:DUF561 domain-containing protein [Bacteroidota bacterium]